jgi:hypothetical protein
MRANVPAGAGYSPAVLRPPAGGMPEADERSLPRFGTVVGPGFEPLDSIPALWGSHHAGTVGA